MLYTSIRTINYSHLIYYIICIILCIFSYCIEELWKELSKNMEETYPEGGSVYSYLIVFIHINFIILVFYFHIKYPEWYLYEYTYI